MFESRLPKNYHRGEELTKAQRDWILRRDNYTSQLRIYTEEEGWEQSQGLCGEGREIGCRRLNVHHIVPSGIEGGNRPTNLITVFECEHTGTCRDGKIKRT